MIRALRSRLTMKPTGEVFIDMLTWQLIQYWEDCYGDKWMAASKWGIRVKTN